MDSKTRRQTVMLTALGVVFVAVLAYQFWPVGSASTSAPSTVGTPVAGAPRAAAGGPRGTAPTGPLQVVDVRVAQLDEPPPAVGSSGRNPFRFRVRGAAPQPTPAPQARPGASAAQAEPPEPDGPGGMPPPPIMLKFIGMVSGESQTGKVAVLSDGTFVYYGREGDIIEGRYRLLTIGEESVQLEYVDGKGRPTIRLSGA